MTLRESQYGVKQIIPTTRPSNPYTRLCSMICPMCDVIDRCREEEERESEPDE